MNIVFATEHQGHGACIMRATWPSLWINKFTEHSSIVLDHTQTMSSAHDCLIERADILVCHKSTGATLRAATVAKKAGVKIVYDTDDYDDAVFGRFYPLYLTQNVIGNQEWFREHADGVTVASSPLKDKWPGSRLIENGFDVTLPQFQPRKKEYIGGRVKIAWGGSSTHARGIEMFLKLSFLPDLLREQPIDFYFYGLQKEVGRKSFGEGNVFFHPSNPRGIEWYIYEYFCDADFLIAPLVVDEFNNHRSTLKIAEAGVAGKTIITSAIDSYDRALMYGGFETSDNTSENWEGAITDMIAHRSWRDELAQINNQNAQTIYSAETLTKQRIEYFTEIVNG